MTRRDVKSVGVRGVRYTHIRTRRPGAGNVLGKASMYRSSDVLARATPSAMAAIQGVTRRSW